MSQELETDEVPLEPRGEVEEVLPVVPRERYDLRILSSLRRIVRSIDSHSRRLAAESGMTVPQLLCMLKLDELGPLTIKDLASEVFLSPSTTVGIVDRLVKSGALARERSVRDRRRVRITLTEKGRQMVASSPSPLQENLVDAIDKLPELERATIALSLEKIIECIDAPVSEAADSQTAPILETTADLRGNGRLSPRSVERTDS
ncbi:MarR family transcriptional regulator [Pelagicoccus sp. NFK12]|uniref:MarR family transcriptional regulator n=1 Tax=Pelagicoccus enzymogenes TaxID=2773457 RepID=A0A927FCJ5_9BACT|nr:MarR family transcriptional regulator [Pelagicoccus enzymogenes]MBD5781281.1 MarR family transcriptional regulator [Pelagicoccus enzymogenes]MDQ8198816.1 MarR family transcriptional regulator [Pelagicoccus enzymogenes]